MRNALFILMEVVQIKIPVLEMERLAAAIDIIACKCWKGLPALKSFYVM